MDDFTVIINKYLVVWYGRYIVWFLPYGWFEMNCYAYTFFSLFSSQFSLTSSVTSFLKTFSYTPMTCKFIVIFPRPKLVSPLTLYRYLANIGKWTKSYGL